MKKLTLTIGVMCVSAGLIVAMPATAADPIKIAGANGAASLSLSPDFLWVGADTKVRAKVKDADGDPVSGVPVVLAKKGKGGVKTKKTDASGRATFTNVRASSTKTKWVASVDAFDLTEVLRAKRQTSRSAIKLSTRKVRVGVATTFKVKLRAPDGSPLRGVRVKVSGQGTGDTARTNKKGIAKLEVEPDSAGLLTVKAPKATTGKQKLGAVSNGGGGQLTG